MLESHAEQGGLISRIANGDVAAFERLVTEHGPALYRLVRAIAGANEADDAFQETLIQVYRRAVTFDPTRGQLRPWLFAIARREAYHRRDHDPVDSTDSQSLAELGAEAGWAAPNPETLASYSEDAERLSWAIASLPAKDREVLVLRDVEGTSGEETAALLQIDLVTMKSRLHRARLKLMAALRESRTMLTEHEREKGGLRCSEVLAVLDDFIDARLGQEQQGKVVAHLKECEVCERFGGHYQRTVSGLRTRLGLEPAVDTETLERVLTVLRPSLTG